MRRHRLARDGTGRRGAAHGGGTGNAEGHVEAGLDPVDAEELVGIARRLDVPSVAMLRCSFTLEQPDADGAVLARGMLDASVERICVVSLEPFQQTVQEPFSVRFVPERGRAPDGEPTTEMLDPEEVDEVFYSRGMIDLAEAAVEQLALCLDPYPRRPGLELDPEVGSEVLDADAPPHPFAGLARLKRSDGTRH
jgi:uncharacterized metal-binding protein YceD (DUF177 family)